MVFCWFNLSDIKDKHSKTHLVNSSVVLVPDLMNASKGCI